MNTINVHILMGLPGSGKTTFISNELLKTHYSSNLIIDLDKYQDDDNTDIATYIKQILNEHFASYTRNLYIDGLILTKDTLFKIIAIIHSYMNENYDNALNFTIHIWNENKNACLANDAKRVKYNLRDKSSEITIKNASFEIISDNDIKELYDLGYKDSEFHRMYHDVYMATTEEIILTPYMNINFKTFEKEPFLSSSTWSTGGTWCDCWGGESIIHPEKQPEFTELDEMLGKICPNITFLQYKRIMSECVEIIETREHDYYGGTEYKNHYQCDLKQLYKVLTDMNLITEE